MVSGNKLQRNFEPVRAGWFVLAGLLIAGCQSAVINNTDKHVYRAIEERQRDALGTTTNVHIGRETGRIGRNDSMYEFVPRPTSDQVPPEFKGASESKHADEVGDSDAAAYGVPDAAQPMPATAAPPPGETEVAAVAPQSVEQVEASPQLMSPDVFTEAERPYVQTFGLADALAYAQRHGRNLQDAKEILYLEALDLTLERHLWTPQFVADVQAEFVDTDQAELDRAMTAVADVAVAQRLPYGGELTARMVNRLVRDLDTHTTTGESGNLILEADIPLLRGAGRVAYESRYQAERDLIYAVRTYERFRRSYLVEVASSYFELQQLRSSIDNTFESYKNRRLDWEKADFINRMGQSRTIFEAPRAQSSLRQAESALVRAKEAYEAGLDRFKIFIGMPIPELLDVLDQNADAASQQLDELLPNIEIATAVDVALKYRLDLLNTADRVDDARRGVTVAKNLILPDVRAVGSVNFDTDPEHLNSAKFEADRETWRGLLTLRMDDRKRERNAYRASLVALRASERDFEVAADTVRADVRRAARRIRQQASLRDIQAANVEENELRVEAARAQFDLGKITNEDVVDAETDLLSARNELANAIRAYRVAILEFRRDTETLRVDEIGQWVRP